MKAVRVGTILVIIVISAYYAKHFSHRWYLVYSMLHAKAFPGTSYDPDVQVYVHIKMVAVILIVIALLATLWFVIELYKLTTIVIGKFASRRV